MLSLLLRANAVRRTALGATRARGLRVRRDVAYGPAPDQRLDTWALDDEPRPVVVLLHGGGWVEGTRRDFVALAPRFARAGLLAVALDYRLAPASRWPAPVEDVDRLRARLPELGGDPDRVVLWGHSAGGHIALLAARPGDRGVVALGAPVEADDPRVFDAPANPIDHAPPCPVLLVHGSADPVVPVDGARRYAARYHARLVEARGGDHGLRRPPWTCFPARRAAYDQVLEWLRPPSS